MESKELNKRYFYLLFASKHTTPILEMTFVTLNNIIIHLPKILIYNTFAPIKQKCKFLDIYCLQLYLKDIKVFYILIFLIY